FDTVVTGTIFPIFGDIYSDEASTLVSDRPLTTSNVAWEQGVAQASGLSRLVPLSALSFLQAMALSTVIILSAAMVLRYDLSRAAETDLKEQALDVVMDKGYTSPDIEQAGTTPAGCRGDGRQV
ncbi:unnamed protein product, partial [Hapterophycus canaliculatus]